MALVLGTIYNYYHYLFYEFEDPRMSPYFLVHSPIPVLSIIVLYLFFVLKWGPEYMQDRKPYDLKNVIKFYNLFQVCYNLYFATYGLWNSYLQSNFSFVCQPYDPTDNRESMQRLLYAGFMYYLSKYVDLLDTVFFVLRKKNNQISFLHVYHHAGMVMGVYVYLKYLAGSHPTLLGILNGYVHVFMYSYYFITSLGENYSKKFAWCKKYVTQIQLLQFALLVVHFILPLLQENCPHPKFISMVGITQNAFMFALFFDFYYKSYIKKNK
ncbi:unnamed protein product [Hermetia illucens]|uniref:Elongation of very long chain fatty acids protein n=1 Tax=Hermetia illucens TaxID=343691 RepID=A0A7R8YZ53_HERIL|nr:elongation of very long chain fatty acids protein AAEL008004-like [Hermetia illucens]CAD7087451.1 unnamed protein product [Hermetia illucens]